MTDIQIPREAVRDAKIAWANNGGPTSDDDMAAAIRAALAAWPGMFYHPARQNEQACVFLPLPQDPRDE